MLGAYKSGVEVLSTEVTDGSGNKYPLAKEVNLYISLFQKRMQLEMKIRIIL